MSYTIEDFDDIPTSRGPVSQILNTLFIGIPMTCCLIVGLAAYCIAEYVKYSLFPAPQSLGLSAAGELPAAAPATTSEEQAFTSSLTNFAQNLGPKVTVVAGETKTETSVNEPSRVA